MSIRVALLGFIFFMILPEFITAGNNPCSATALPPNMVEFQSVQIGTTTSQVEDPECGQFHGGDEWFSFTVPPGGDVAVQLLEGSISNAAFAVYEGTCNNLNEILCRDDYLCGTESMPAYFFEDLVEGETYYLRIWNEDGLFAGNVEIMIAHPSGNPYITTGNAVNTSFQGMSNCIQLTEQLTGQVGCAWYPEEVDFNEPFEHEFNIYLGTVQGQAGADGMAIIYQVNGIPICGDAGGGIGYQGINNSWAIEFDTYQNWAPYIDPTEDHTAISLNGDLTYHPSGPVGLGILSDGEFHEVVCSWDPIEQRFRVWFDGELVHDLVYDIVNDVFGGQNTAHWGVSASTGGSVNEHILCFDNIELEDLINAYSYEEVSICEGESYYAGGDYQTEAGTYVDVYAAANGCDSFVTTELSLFPRDEPTVLEIDLCPGEQFIFQGVPLEEAGSYDFYLTDQYGCDSLVIIEIAVPIHEGYLIQNGPLTCKQEEVEIAVELFTEADEVIFSWSSFNGNIVSSRDSSVVVVDAEGHYSVEMYFYNEGVLCGPYILTETVIREEVYPVENIIEEGMLGCNEETVILDASNSQNSDQFAWETLSGGEIIGDADQSSVEINGPGTYQLTLTHLITGCTKEIQLEVEPPPGVPHARINLLDSLKCGQSSIWLNAEGSTVDDHIVYKWEAENDRLLSSPDSFSVNVEGEGQVILSVIDTLDQCTTTTQLELIFDYDFLTAELWVSDTLNCQNLAVEIGADLHSDHFQAFFSWENAQGMSLYESHTSQSIEVDTGGWYFFHAYDVTGRCHYSDSIQVREFRDPVLVELGENKNFYCSTDTLILGEEMVLSDSSLTLMWSSPDGQIVSEPDQKLIEVAGPGRYFLEVEHPISKCKFVDSLDVFDRKIYPEIELSDTLFLNCLELEKTVRPQIQSQGGYEFIWYFPDTTSVFSEEEEITVRNDGTYKLQVRNTETDCMVERFMEVLVDTVKPEIFIGGETLINCALPQSEVEVFFADSTLDKQIIWRDEAGVVLLEESPVLHVEEGGRYFVQVENTDNRCLSKDSIWVEADFSTPEFRLTSPDTLNCLDSLAIIFVDMEGPPRDLSFEWFGPDGKIDFGADSLHIKVETPGMYWLEVTDLESHCKIADSFRIQGFFNPADFELWMSDTVLNCNRGEIEVELNFIGDRENLTINWKTQEGERIDSLDNADEAVIGTAGKFLVSAMDERSLCEYQLEFTVEENFNYPYFTLENDGVLSCVKDSVTIQLVLIDFQENLEISWWNQDGEMHVHYGKKEIGVDAPGPYLAKAVDQVSGCSVEELIEVLRPGESIDAVELLVQDVNCEGENGAVMIENIEGGLPPFLITLNNTESTGNPLEFFPLGAGEYEIEVVDSMGCSWNKTVELKKPLQLELDLPGQYFINEGEQVDLMPEINKPESDLVEIYWEPASYLSCQNCLNTTADPPLTTSYHLWVTDIDGCTAEAITEIVVKLRKDVFIPNAFSPQNRDGINDYFFPLFRQNRVRSILQFQVYDRWGERVFSAVDLPPDRPDLGWEGTAKGEWLHSGIYIYFIEIEWIDGERSTHYGEISLIH
nr:gliding motility-associated C-terminal domain-containing protein [Saprospiraceae bacterium]